MEDNLWWKTSFDGRLPLMNDNLRWKMTFDKRWPSMENNLWWRIKIVLWQNIRTQDAMLQYTSTLTLAEVWLWRPCRIVNQVWWKFLKNKCKFGNIKEYDINYNARNISTFIVDYLPILCQQICSKYVTVYPAWLRHSQVHSTPHTYSQIY